MPGIKTQQDIVYAVHDGFELKGDLYAPEGPGPFPALLLIHGGAWQMGSKNQWTSWGPYLAGHGYTAFAISYRLSTPKTPSFMESIWDVKAAVQFLRSRASDLRVDPGRIAGVGLSAGAHLVSMLTLAGDDPRFRSPHEEASGRGSAKLNAAIVVAGVYDLITQWEHDQLHRPMDQMTEKYLGGTPMDARERFYEASPIYHASRQNAEDTRWLIAWGTEDDVVDPESQAKAFATHLKRAGAVVRTATIVGGAHFWLIDSSVEEGPNPYLAGQLLTFLRTWAGWAPHPRL